MAPLRIPPGLVLTAGCAVFVALSLVPLWTNSPTYDEGIHLSAAFAGLTRKDYRLVLEHPPLGRRLAALPLLFQKVSLPEEPKHWTSDSYWSYSFQFLYQCGNDADTLLRSGRLAMLFWPLLLIGAAYAWALDLFGPKGALLTLVLSVFNPTLLAHGHLVTTDTAVAALMLLSLAAYQRWLVRPSSRTAIECGLMVGGAIAAKLSGLLIVVALGLHLSWRLWKILFGAAPPLPGPKLRRGLEVALMIVVVELVLWGVYGFRFRASPDPAFDLRSVIVNPAWSSRLLGFPLLPESYSFGIANLNALSALGHPTFLLGEHSLHGWPAYFLFALLVKTPVAALLLFGAAAWAWMRRRSTALPGEGVLLLAATLLLAVSSLSHLQIGIRHILPIFGFLAVLAGGLFAGLPRFRDSIAAGLLATLVIGVLAASPSYLAYFNLPSRLFAAPHRMLVDSNLDWGQDLSRLKKYMESNRIATVKLGYFGSASPRHLRLDHQRLPALNLYSQHEPEWRAAAGFAPGDVVAVSATCYAGAYLEHPDFYRRALGHLQPEAVLGGSILVYRIPERR
jgi:hypothetical protein